MGDPPKTTIDPATLRIQQEAQADKITAIQERAAGDTRDTLIRFGRQPGAAAASDLIGGDTSTVLNASLFGGRRLDLLRGLGRL